MTKVVGVTTKENGFVPQVYLDAIRKSGGQPLIIPTDGGSAENLISRIDGLMVTGGEDLDPSNYDEEAHPQLGHIDRARDAEELALLTWAVMLDMPTLCICRGTQALNVAMGGTLWQDLFSQRPTDIEHEQKEPGTKTTHKCYIRPGSLLHQSTDTVELRVNSHHHQSVKDLGRGLAIDAVAPDGIVEAISYPGKLFVLGCQFHPEKSFPIGARSRMIFKSFINAIP